MRCHGNKHEDLNEQFYSWYVLKTEFIIFHNLIYFRHYEISFWPWAIDIVLVSFADLTMLQWLAALVVIQSFSFSWYDFLLKPLSLFSSLLRCDILATICRAICPSCYALGLFLNFISRLNSSRSIGERRYTPIYCTEGKPRNGFLSQCRELLYSIYTLTFLVILY